MTGRHAALAFTGTARRWRGLVLGTLGMKMVVLGMAVVSAQVLTARGPGSLLSVVAHGDAANYLAIAIHGYASSAVPTEFVVYPPLFSGMVAGAALIVRDVAASALLVTGIAAVVTVLLLDTLASREVGDREGLAALALLSFPTAYALHLPFSESVFLALTLGAFLAARVGRWGAAGILATLATLTRATGIVLLPALAAQALLEWRRTRHMHASWAWLAVIPFALVCDLAVGWLLTGDPGAFASAYSRGWGKQLDWPWVGIGNLIGFATDRTNLWQFWSLEIVFVVIGLVTTVLSAVRLALPYTVWLAISWLLFVSTTVIASVPRYTLTLFPLFFLLVDPMRSARWKRAITIPGIALQLFLVARFELGQWAF